MDHQQTPTTFPWRNKRIEQPTLLRPSFQNRPEQAEIIQIIKVSNVKLNKLTATDVHLAPSSLSNGQSVKVRNRAPTVIHSSSSGLMKRAI